MKGRKGVISILAFAVFIFAMGCDQSDQPVTPPVAPKPTFNVDFFLEFITEAAHVTVKVLDDGVSVTDATVSVDGTDVPYNSDTQYYEIYSLPCTEGSAVALGITRGEINISKNLTVPLPVVVIGTFPGPPWNVRDYIKIRWWTIIPNPNYISITIPSGFTASHFEYSLDNIVGWASNATIPSGTVTSGYCEIQLHSNNNGSLTGDNLESGSRYLLVNTTTLHLNM